MLEKVFYHYYPRFLSKIWRFGFSHKSATKGYFGSHIFRRTFLFALKFGNLLYLRLTYHWCKNERYSISRKKAQIFPSQIHRVNFSNSSTKNPFKYSAFDSLKDSKKNPQLHLTIKSYRHSCFH